jgi:hypothetical protein
VVAATETATCSGPLEIGELAVSSGLDEGHLIDGDPTTTWRSAVRLGPGRREWIRLELDGHCELERTRLKPSPDGGFPSSFRIRYSTDAGATWYSIPGADFNRFPDPGPAWVHVDLPSIIADAVLLEATYLSMDRWGNHTFGLSEIVVEGNGQPGPFSTSIGGTWDADLNMMWKVFGTAEEGLGAVAKIGGESAWMEWNALKFCWYDDPSLRGLLRRHYIQCTVGLDGYVWSWGSQEGWPTHGHRHYDSNAKFIAGASRYFLWTGDEDFLSSSSSSTTDMSLSIGYLGMGEARWDSPDHVAVKLEEGNTLGQSFTARESFDSVGGSFPTYLTTGSGMTLRLHGEGPEGIVIAERSISNHPDNAWAALEFEAQPPGRYYLEMCCPSESVGWWSLNDDRIPGGEAHLDGVPVVRDSRSLLDRLRAAMEFQLEDLNGEEGLIVIEDKYSNGTHNGFPTDYWDNFPFGYMSATSTPTSTRPSA